MIQATLSGYITLALGMPGGWEWIVLLVLGLLIFGRRLPDVGRSLGRGIIEFKRGIKGIEEEIEEESGKPASRLSDQTTPQVSTPVGHLERSGTSEKGMG